MIGAGDLRNRATSISFLTLTDKHFISSCQSWEKKVHGDHMVGVGMEAYDFLRTKSNINLLRERLPCGHLHTSFAL